MNQSVRNRGIFPEKELLRVFENRDIIRMFDGLSVAESFLLKTTTREILLRKRA